MFQKFESIDTQEHLDTDIFHENCQGLFTDLSYIKEHTCLLTLLSINYFPIKFIHWYADIRFHLLDSNIQMVLYFSQKLYK